MRSTTVLALALVAAAGPALAQSTTAGASRQPLRGGRITSGLRVVRPLGAFPKIGIPATPATGSTPIVGGSTGQQFNFPTSQVPPTPGKPQLVPLTQASSSSSSQQPAARSFASDFASGFEKGFVGTLNAVAPVLGDVADLLKREEVARSFGSDFETGFVDTLKTLGPIVGAFLKREEMARSFGSDFETGFEDTLKTLGPIVGAFLKREEVARSFGSDFETGFVDTLKTLGPIVGAFLKREEMMSRSFGSDFETGFVDTLKTLGPIVGAFLKRELHEELLAREPKRHPKLFALHQRSMNDLD